jgi:alkaline phosphatase
MLTRRGFFERGGLLASTTLVGAPFISRGADSQAGRPGQKPERIIHMVADGMSMGTLTMADAFSWRLRGRGLTCMNLMNHPAAGLGLMNMRSLNSLVTDSSAASSSWGSGSRIINGAVNQLPDGRELIPLYSLFRQKGWKRGLVTTAEITHATPAGFAANVDERDTGSMIAVQYLEREVDVLLGGGKKFFEKGQRKDKRDLRADYAQAGYQVMETSSALAGASMDQRWLGIFDNSHLPFSIDHKHDPKLWSRVPTLARMTQSALGWLRRYPRFILQVEGARVDQACHNFDVAASLHEMLAFDEALDLVLEYQKAEPTTLVVVTTDHGTGNPSLLGLGKGYGQSSWLFYNTLNYKASIPEILKAFKKPSTSKKTETAAIDKKDDEGGAVEDRSKKASADPKDKSGWLPDPDLIRILKEKTGLPYISTRRMELVRALLEKKSSMIFEALNNETSAL